MVHEDAFFTQSEGWDPPPTPIKDSDQWRQQYHLRFTPVHMVARRNLAVVLCPGHASLQPAATVTERVGATEVAHIGEDLVLVNQTGRIEYEQFSLDALALLCVRGQHYALDEGGLVKEIETCR